MERILKSSNFWNAFIASAVMFATAKFVTGDIQDKLLMYEFVLFGGRTAVTGVSDLLKASKGITYNQVEGKEELVK